MAYDTENLKKQSLEAIEEHSLYGHDRMDERRDREVCRLRLAYRRFER